MRRLWLLFSQAVTVALAVLFVVGTLKPHWLGALGAGASGPAVVSIRTAPAPAPGAGASAVGVSTAAAPLPGLAMAARRAAPAVASVMASRAHPPLRNQSEEDDAWLRFFQGQQPQATQGVGSAVIVSPEGYLLTNNHVVEGATQIDVRLADGREARARLVGTDPETDMAVLKIDLDRLPAVTLGNSETLQVGDAVLAIGNPFNVGQTVTAGIVSALGRNQLQLSTFENFIQTDAAINPGNSGGALVDASGHLVGINTAIYSRSGGSLGIGFAIPVDTARQVMEGLIKDGQVTRGWIGVEPNDLTPEFAESFKLPVREGVLISGVLQDGPADKGGLRPGDVVVAVAGQPVANTAQLLRQVAALRPDSRARLGVQRGQQALQVELTVGKRPKVVAAQRAPR
ncbi:trypsin-like serine protease with PDZ domain [Burkholderiales bacterium JOSHI_001]|nr:trypsin-like serine protease with PDZ domain [Burkholderiales bacterium JOSHI_001]